MSPQFFCTLFLRHTVPVHPLPHVQILSKPQYQRNLHFSLLASTLIGTLNFHDRCTWRFAFLCPTLLPKYTIFCLQCNWEVPWRSRAMLFLSFHVLITDYVPPRFSFTLPPNCNITRSPVFGFSFCAPEVVQFKVFCKWNVATGHSWRTASRIGTYSYDLMGQ